MLMAIQFLCAAAVHQAALAPAGLDAPVLDDSSVSQWREYLQPTEAELCWRTIPWRETFQQAVHDSQIEGKPILLWAMNGHPLGCV